MPAALYRIVSQGTFGGKVRINNAFHVFTNLGTPSAINVLDDWVAAIWDTIRQNSCDQYLMEGASCQRMLPDTADKTSVVINQNGALGLGTGQSTLRIGCISTVCGVITWRTSQPGRSGRGRTYVGGLRIAHSDAVTWSQENLNQLTTIAQAFATHYQPANNVLQLQFAVFSRKAGGRVPPYSEAGIQPVTSFTVQRYYATMGSRRLGRGL